jgi:hypothetical protein
LRRKNSAIVSVVATRRSTARPVLPARRFEFEMLVHCCFGPLLRARLAIRIPAVQAWRRPADALGSSLA